MQYLRSEEQCQQYRAPLAVHFVWHPSDAVLVNSILEVVSTHLSRNIDRPFSRNLNIPLFLYSSNSPAIAPADPPQELAERNALFVFTSINTRGYDDWNSYIKLLPNKGPFRIIPLALSDEGLGHGEEGSLKNINFVRVYDWPKEFIPQHAIIVIAHEIYRHGFVEIEKDDKGKSSSIRLFLSHAKSGDIGRRHAETIKSFIDNTNMSPFFDATEISPGFKFDEEIVRYIKESTIVAIGSDVYSSRYWCQREILCAKEYRRPMIAVNCLEDYEDRIFPAGSNVPCVHVPPEAPLSKPDILRILSAAILETIRHHHALRSLEYYKSMGWISKDCVTLSRPPEIQQLLTLKTENISDKVCYPEPPIYSEEADWHRQLGIDTFTPLWSKSESLLFSGLRIGISISDVPNTGFSENHLPTNQSTRLAQDLARHLLARSATLIYGGDLRKDGFTEFILNEAISLKNRLKSEKIHVENHLSWPLHKSGTEMTAWRSKYRAIMKTVEYDVPDDISGNVDKETFLPASSPLNKYYWSRCLTEMRLKSISSSHARICAGGKLFGYNGKMPGVLEEILIAIHMNKPIYLLGAFGGVAGMVCIALSGESYPMSLTESWQNSHNAEYIDIQAIARTHGMHADYKQTKKDLARIDIPTLSTNAGLDEEAYRRLMKTPFVDECVHLIIRGLKKVSLELLGNTEE